MQKISFKQQYTFLLVLILGGSFPVFGSKPSEHPSPESELVRKMKLKLNELQEKVSRLSDHQQESVNRGLMKTLLL